MRYLGMYYNDAVHPQDPYDFVGLLRGQDMLASQRNPLLRALARQVQESPSLQDGDRVTVDDHLGIVTVGSPEFRLELER